MLWSREPWNQVDDNGNDSMPPGRFVSGVTQTSVGEVTVIGICIPWFGSRTEANRKVERPPGQTLRPGLPQRTLSAKVQGREKFPAPA